MNEFLMLTFYRSQFLENIVINPVFMPKWFVYLIGIVNFLILGIGVLIYGIYKAFYKIPKKKKGYVIGIWGVESYRLYRCQFPD